MIGGKFKFLINSNPRSPEDIKEVEKRVTEYVRLIDPGYTFEIKQFAGIHVILIWEGIPKNLDDSQGLFNYMRKRLDKHLKAYEMIIKIELEEEGF